ncbi:MAG: DUF5362 family protein [Candidatus Krumholzibacteria bacterium]|nr:DUF5362 family protein [Candidatus Krumholzibacteria bacterium]
MENMEMGPAAPEPHVSAFDHPMGPGFADTLGHMRFMGWMGMVYGIITCLSIVGAIVGIPLILASNRFLGGIKRFENYRHDCSEAELKAGFADLGSSFRTMKILSIIYIALIICYIGLLFMLGGIGLLSELGNS